MIVRAHVAAWILTLLAVAMAVASCTGSSRAYRSYLAAHEQELTLRAAGDFADERFIVAPGTPARTIGDNLLAAGLIGDAYLFEAYVSANDLANRFEEIAAALQNSAGQVATVTVREGWRLEQIAAYLVAIDLFGDRLTGDSAQAAEYLRLGLTPTAQLLERYPFLAARPAAAPLEGYLFPDTYQLPLAEPTALDLLSRQLDAFARRVLPAYDAAVNSGQTSLSLHAVLTLASIVEREAVVASERPAIAGVYLNRLEAGIKLEADPTVQYAMGYQAQTDQWWKTPVFLEEYSSVFSPYNTYLHAGLPPGPIASPGMDSIAAVLAPESHGYFYFVALPDGSGAHVFATTFEEHKVNVDRYLGRR